jgi:hypothetical protein
LLALRQLALTTNMFKRAILLPVSEIPVSLVSYFKPAKGALP